ncbi:MAG: Uma2 family endonuclease [Pyrinomonadaceae bacterium]
MSVQIAKHWFTVTEYERMGELGILPAEKRYELMRGEIVEMSPIGKRHAACVKRLIRMLGSQVNDSIIISIQDPIQLDDYSEPQPDVALLKFRDDFYSESLPAPADVLLVVEVSDTTLDYDRQFKLADYARAGIPEVLICNLPDDQLEYYAQPADGAYQVARILQRGERLASASIPDAVFDVVAILG